MNPPSEAPPSASSIAAKLPKRPAPKSERGPSAGLEGVFPPALLQLTIDGRQGKRTERQQTVVESRKGKGRPLPLGRLGPPSLDLPLADLVGEGLPGLGDVAIDFDLGVERRHPGLHHLCHGPIPIPAE